MVACLWWPASSSIDRQAVAKGRAVPHLGVAALQVTPVHYLFRPDDEAMLQHFRTIAEETGLPLFI